MATQCVLFDLFGTLLHYDSGRTSQKYDTTYEFVRSLAGDVGYDQFLATIDRTFAELDQWSEQQQLEFSMFEFAAKCLKALGAAPELMDDASCADFSEYYTREWSAAVSAVPGVKALLSRTSKKFKTGLITNTHHEPMIHRLLEQWELKAFSVITTSVTHGRRKPHPEIFLDTLALLQLQPEEAVYVGDSYQADYKGATNVGMQCYLIGQNARVPREYRIPSVIDLPLHLIR